MDTISRDETKMLYLYLRLKEKRIFVESQEYKMCCTLNSDKKQTEKKTNCSTQDEKERKKLYHSVYRLPPTEMFNTLLHTVSCQLCSITIQWSKSFNDKQ